MGQHGPAVSVIAEKILGMQKTIGEIPTMEIKLVVKARHGDLRKMVLPGGGDLTTRVWSSMRVNINELEQWKKQSGP